MKIFKIFIGDIKNILKNPAALIIVGGLCLIPSLYAWVNIIACWNPYVNTGNLPVAIVNNDEGVVLQGKEINAGKDIVDELKKNKEIGWKFENEWQANYELNEGKCYALIEIPQDFSKDLTSLITSTPIKPNIIYKANEKVNAIATKITEIAESKVVEQIKSSFVNAVNKQAFTILNKMGKELETNKPQIIQLNNSLKSANSQLEDIKKYIGNAKKNSEGFQKYLNEVKNNIPTVTKQINSLQQITEASKSLISSTKNSLNMIDNNLNNDINNMKVINKDTKVLLDKLKLLDDTKLKSETSTIINNIIRNIDLLSNIAEYESKLLQGMNFDKGNYIVTNIINSLNNIQRVLVKEKNQLNILNNDIKINKDIENSIDNIILINNEVTNSVDILSNKIYSSGVNKLDWIESGLNVGIDNANSTLQSIKIIVPQLNALTNYGIESGKVASSSVDNLTNRLDKFQCEINKLSEKTSVLTEKKLDDLINLMNKNPDDMASFMSSPIKVNKVEIYNTGIFGVALTPFYTVLAIWVGVVLLTALLTTECKQDNTKEDEQLIKKHFGKMLTFMFLSLIQSLIIVSGDVYMLGIKPENMILLVLFTLLASITFTIIVFTLVSLFGNIGKAISIFIMVFQIAGSGGIYPIQTNPKIFELLQPLWPFTYVIDGFREAIAGPIWPNVYKDIKALLLFSLIFLSLVILKKPFYKLTNTIQINFKESGL